MKKFSWIFALILALSLVFVFAGCGEEPSNPGTYDGSGPVTTEILSLWVDEFAPGTTVLTNNDFGDYFERSGSPTITNTADGIKISGCTNDWDALTIKTEFFSDVLGVAPPFDITFIGKALAAGTMKIDPAGADASPITGSARKKTVAADAAFEITGTVSAGSLTATQYTPGVRLQSEGGAVDHIISQILVIKK